MMRSTFTTWSRRAIALALAALVAACGFQLRGAATYAFESMAVIAPVGPFLTELYPSRVRGSGQGFVYNFGRGMSAFATPLVGYLSSTISLGKAIGLVAIVGFAVVILVVALLPETRGKTLVVYD